MGLIVGFGWVDNVVDFGNIVRLVVGCMMMKLVGVGRPNRSGQTQTMLL